jgi:hypothetical protein
VLPFAGLDCLGSLPPSLSRADTFTAQAATEGECQNFIPQLISALEARGGALKPPTWGPSISCMGSVDSEGSTSMALTGPAVA